MTKEDFQLGTPIVIIAALETIALIKGLNGVALSASIGAIAAITGFKFGKRKENFMNNPKIKMLKELEKNKTDKSGLVEKTDEKGIDTMDRDKVNLFDFIGKFAAFGEVTLGFYKEPQPGAVDLGVDVDVPFVNLETPYAAFGVSLLPIKFQVKVR